MKKKRGTGGGNRDEGIIQSVDVKDVGMAWGVGG